MLSKILKWLGVPTIKALTEAVAKPLSFFRENEEAAARREISLVASAHRQYANEFVRAGNWFDSIVNGLNRLPRPTLALGTIWVFAYAFYNPVKFAEGAQSLQLIPDELWWMMGGIVAFYFGVRTLEKSKDDKNRIELAKKIATKQPIQEKKPRNARRNRP